MLIGCPLKRPGELWFATFVVFHRDLPRWKKSEKSPPPRPLCLWIDIEWPYNDGGFHSDFLEWHLRLSKYWFLCIRWWCVFIILHKRVFFLLLHYCCCSVMQKEEMQLKEFLLYAIKKVTLDSAPATNFSQIDSCWMKYFASYMNIMCR